METYNNPLLKPPFKKPLADLFNVCAATATAMDEHGNTNVSFDTDEAYTKEVYEPFIKPAMKKMEELGIPCALLAVTGKQTKDTVTHRTITKLPNPERVTLGWLMVAACISKLAEEGRDV